MKPYIKQFANAVYGTNAELALASFNQQKFLEDATSKIVTLEAENAKMRDVVEAARNMASCNVFDKTELLMWLGPVHKALEKLK